MVSVYGRKEPGELEVYLIVITLIYIYIYIYYGLIPVLSSFYEPWSLMRKQRHEVSIAEMLMGLNSLEFNLCLRGADLDNNPASDRIEWSVLFAQHQQPLGATSVDR